MLEGFDPEAEGKRIYDLRPLVADDAALQEDVICVIRNGEGPTVLLCGGIHGDEFEPQVVLRQLIRDIEPADVRGRIIIIPTINPPASQRGERISPVDGKNMNRVFPGKADGTGTERLAAFLHDQVFPLGDLLVDLHTGGGDYRVVPLIFGFSAPGCALDDAALEQVMEDWGYPVIQYVNGIASTSAGAAPLAGIASVETEGGGGGALLTEEIDILRDGVLRGLRAHGVLSGARTEPRGAVAAAVVRVDVGAANQHEAPHDGLIEHRVSLGADVAEGDLLAVIHPSAGGDATPTEIRAKGPGMVLRQRARFFVRKGELVANTGTRRS